MKHAKVLLLLFILYSLFSAHIAQATTYVDNPTIDSDTTFYASASPYVVSGDIFVASGTTLTIEPGTVLKFDFGSDIGVFGKLVVGGAGATTTFTSLYDDSILGDTNLDDVSEGSVGNWGGIYVGSGGEYQLNNVIISYSGDVLISQSSFGKLENVVIKYTRGITLLNGASLSATSVVATNISGGFFTGLYGSAASFSNLVLSHVDGDGFFLQKDSSISLDNIFTDTITNFMELSDSSSGVVSSSKVQNVNGDLFSVLVKSALKIDTSTFQITTGNLFDVYSMSSVDVSSSSFDTFSGPYGISISYESTGNIVDSHFDNYSGQESLLSTWANSLVSISRSTFKNISGDDGVLVYSGSKMDISDSEFENHTGRNAMFEVYGSEYYPITPFSISNSAIINGSSTGFQIFGNASSTLSNVKIDNFAGTGLRSFLSATTTIAESVISNNDYGVESYGANIKIENSSIVGNHSYGAYNVPERMELQMSNNWWGDASGPYNEISNPSGIANQVTDGVVFTPWLTRDPTARNPVIIIPGILSSYLNRNDNEKTEVWVNLFKALSSRADDYLDELSLGIFGNPDGTYPIMLPTDIFRKTSSSFAGEVDFFDGLIKQLEADRYVEGEDLFVFPYDWRLDIREIVGNPYSDKLTSLKDKIEQIRQQTGSEKVDIVAHSMGGLLAKYYIEHFGTSTVGTFVDIATPHLGSPDAFKTLNYGDDIGIKFGPFGLNKEEIKKISQNMPSVYELLPSAGYFSSSTPDYTYYIDDLDDIDSDGVKGRLSFSDTTNLLKNLGRNSLLLNNAIAFHEDTDKVNPSDYGISTYNIVGCGVPTIGKIFTLGKQSDTDPQYDVAYIAGDATVPQRSAEALPDAEKYYITGIEHATMPSSNGIKELVSSLLLGNKNMFDFTSYQNVATTSAKCALPNGTYLSFHSPVDVHIYDEDDNHTGPNASGDIEESIPGIGYDIIEGNKFAYLPAAQKYRVELKATATGTFSSHVKKIENENVVSTSYFSDIPLLSTSTQAEVDISDISPVIILDSNGDGREEKIISPSSVASGDSLEDRIVPETSYSLSSSVPVSGWFDTAVTMNFSAADAESGVLKTEISFDKGLSFTEITGPVVISTEGENTILYRSVDKAGNIEGVKSFVIKINKNKTAASSRSGGSSQKQNDTYKSIAPASLVSHREVDNPQNLEEIKKDIKKEDVHIDMPAKQQIEKKEATVSFLEPLWQMLYYIYKIMSGIKDWFVRMW